MNDKSQVNRLFRLGWWHDEIMSAMRISPERGEIAKRNACQAIADISREPYVERLFTSSRVYFPQEHGGG